MVSNNEAPGEIYGGFSDDVISNFFSKDSFTSLMGVNSSLLGSNMKFRHQQQQQEENKRKNLAAALTMRTPTKKKEIVLWSIVLNCFGDKVAPFLTQHLRWLLLVFLCKNNTV